MTTSPDQLVAESSTTIANPVKLEQEEQDELASDGPLDSTSNNVNGHASPEGSPSAVSQPNQGQPKSPSVSHQQLQQVLFQQQQLQRSRPSPLGPLENGSTTAARALANVQPRCALCGATNVPLWRREPNGKAICNTCGLASIRRHQSQNESAAALTPTTAPQASSSQGGRTHSSSVSSSSGPPANLQNHPESSVASASRQASASTPQPGQGASAQSDPNGAHRNAQGGQLPQPNPSRRSPPNVPSQASQHPSPSWDWWRTANGKSSNNGVQLVPMSGSGSSRPAPPTIVQSRQSSETRSSEQPIGSCPGGGHCNGQGGKAVCTGCPAFNNRYRVISAASSAPPSDEGGQSHGQAQTVTIVPREAGAAVGVVGSAQSGPAPGLAVDQRMSGSNAGPDAQSTQSQGSEVSAMACENCGTRTTPLWRRDGEGRVACNACGLYYKLHGAHRPVNMNKTTIKRRKRVPAAPGAEGSQVSHHVRTTSTSVVCESDQLYQSNSAGPSGPDQGDGPVKKKARKNQQDAPRSSYGSMQEYGGAPGSSRSSDGGQSSRPRELTRTELEVIAALAMNANHERSLQHSANLDSDLLDHHAHPLHSVPASLSDDRFGSLVPPAAHPTASERSFGSPRDRASNLSLSSDEEHIALHRQELARECEHARQTMSRLGAFLAKSEQLLASMDQKLERAKSTTAKSSEHKEYAHSPLKNQITPATPATCSGTSTPAEIREPTKLESILAQFVPSEAKPSQLLRKRRLETPSEHGAQASPISSKAIDEKRPKKLLWEICPSATPEVVVVATSHKGSNSSMSNGSRIVSSAISA